MKVLHLINRLGAGGAEKLLISFLLHNDQTIQHELCTLLPTPQTEYQCLLDKGIQVHALNFANKYNLTIMAKLGALVRRGHYDLVHIHLWPAQYYGAVVACFVKGPVYIFTEHNSYNRRRAWPIFKFFDFISYLPYRKIICISQTAQKDLHLWVPQVAKKTTMIYNGVPLSPAVEAEKLYDLVLVGSLRSTVKGVDLLLAAVSKLKSLVGKVAIAGDGVHRQALMEQRDRLGLKEQVEFLGNVSDVRCLLEQSKLFVMPSRWEGLPIALLEAMAAGKPIIASQVGGIPELIENERNGLLVSTEDVEALAAAIQRLLVDPALATRLGDQALFDVSTKFSIEVYINQIEHLYHVV